jgi:outer membrane receptor protein involved in Fe transport
VGGFYTNENSPRWQQAYLVLDAVSGATLGSLLSDHFSQKYEEFAAFADVTVKFGDRFDVQVGARESQDRQRYTFTDSGILENSYIPPDYTRENAFTYLFTPRFKITPDAMIYARFASGFRAGGSNPNPSAVAGVPAEYTPDKTLNYEVGAKADLFDHKLSVDASLYYIDWKDVQVALIKDNLSYTANGTRAKSQGVELSVVSRPLDGLSLGAWVAFNDAKLTQDLPASSGANGVSGGIGLSGDRLPFTSRLSANVSADQQFALTGKWNLVVGGAVSYIGDRIGSFTSHPARQYYPGYAQTDLRASVRDEEWSVNLFATNITNRRGELSGGLSYINQNAFQVIQPRTIGISVARSF